MEPVFFVFFLLTCILISLLGMKTALIISITITISFIFLRSIFFKINQTKIIRSTIQGDDLNDFRRLMNQFNRLIKFSRNTTYTYLEEEINSIEKINIICEACFKTRDNLLIKLIIKKNWIATEPAEVKIYTILKTNQLNLIKKIDTKEVIYLLDSLKDEDQEIVNNSTKVLLFEKLMNQEVIDFLCQQWVNDRNRKLEEIIIKQKYIANFPSQVKILTALKTEQLELLSNLNLEETIIVVNAFDDLDKVIGNNAKKMGNFLQEPICKSLIYFLNEQWQQYERIDFDQNLLKNIFNNAELFLRQKITEKIKISGRSDWLQVIFAERKQKNIELMTDYDWQVTVELLNKTDDDREKWKLAQQAPPFYSHQLLKQIHSLNFISGQKTNQLNLIHLAQKVIATNLSSWINDDSETVTLTGHTDWIHTLVINREGTFLASRSNDKTIKLWDLPSGRLLHTLTEHTHWIKSLVMNREGTLLASASSDKTIKLWELPSGRLLKNLTELTESISDSIRDIVMNEEGTLLVSSIQSDYHNHTCCQIRLWELPSGKLFQNSVSYSDRPCNITMNKEGTLLAYDIDDYEDGKIMLLELPSFETLEYFIARKRRNYSLVMNKNGTILVSGSYQTIKLLKLYPMLLRSPLSKIINYYDYIQDTLKRDDLTENRRNWFEFMLALINNYRSFEIDIEDAPIIAEAGEFDIEIEG